MMRWLNEKLIAAAAWGQEKSKFTWEDVDRVDRVIGWLNDLRARMIRELSPQNGTRDSDA